MRMPAPFGATVLSPVPSPSRSTANRLRATRSAAVPLSPKAAGLMEVRARTGPALMNVSPGCTITVPGGPLGRQVDPVLVRGEVAGRVGVV
jgi:hypothetical protein